MAHEIDFEHELTANIAEQQGVLAELVDLLTQGDNEELLAMKQLVENGIKEMESSLLDMKRSKLLNMIDNIATQQVPSTTTVAAAEGDVQEDECGSSSTGEDEDEDYASDEEDVVDEDDGEGPSFAFGFMQLDTMAHAR